MAGIVLVLPYLPSTPTANPWPGLSLRWVADDGSAWPLNGPTARGLALQAGVRGLTLPDGRHQLQTSAGTHGARWVGWTAGVREVFWPLWVWEDGGTQEWLDYDAAFWATLSVYSTGRFEVTTPNGMTRYLTVRVVDDGGHAWEISPGMREWARYAITLQAENPFWQGAAIVNSWHGVTPVEFFPEDGGPEFNIADAATLESATLANPGDEAGWITAWFTGPLDDASVEIDGRLLEVPFEVEDGRMLVVDYDPRVRTAREIDAPPAEIDGEALVGDALEAWVANELVTASTDRTKELGTAQFGGIPAKGVSPLTLTLTGEGTIRARLAPQYHRAW